MNTNAIIIIKKHTKAKNPTLVRTVSKSVKSETLTNIYITAQSPGLVHIWALR
jgi:hypothetical protein